MDTDVLKEWELSPYERLFGQYSDEELKNVQEIHNYIISKPDEDKIYGDQMWLNNCFRLAVPMIQNVRLASQTYQMSNARIIKGK